MELTKRIQVLISDITEVGVFQDALYFTEAEFSVKTEKDIEDAAKERVGDYVDAVLSAPPPVPLTAEQVKQEVERVTADFKRVVVMLEDFKNDKSLSVELEKTAAIVAVLDTK